MKSHEEPSFLGMKIKNVFRILPKNFKHTPLILLTILHNHYVSAWNCLKEKHKAMQPHFRL